MRFSPKVQQKIDPLDAISVPADVRLLGLGKAGAKGLQG
jgi:hypothetical protein